MSDPGGFEPQLGEIRTVRTFRVGPGGLLFPLFSRRPWVDGENEAACSAIHRSDRPADHVPPEPDCTCGFYGYADLSAAGEYPHARHVLAVVSCWGRMIVATKGVRAQYARIDALWMSDKVPADLARSVAERYPSVDICSDRDEMLTAHAPTVLADYERGKCTPTFWWQLSARLVAASAIVAGLLPASSIRELPYGRLVWAVVLGALLCVGLVPRNQRQDAVVHRRRLMCMALALWMIAPFAGAAGVVFMRLPLFQIAVLLSVHRVAMNRMAATFPAEIV